MQHAGLFVCLVSACRLSAVACGIMLPDQGLNLGHLHWEGRVLATGPPGSRCNVFKEKKKRNWFAFILLRYFTSVVINNVGLQLYFFLYYLDLI